tara:strand:+ start:615 stop:1676 length:1062 start_codon:yes stop_codon:yes gene_type:complete
MDYINYVKQQPITGMTGFGGGATGLGRYSSGGYATTGINNGARGIFVGGYDSYQNQNDEIRYITIDTTSNTSDFGDFNQYMPWQGAGCSNGTRGLIIGGYGSHGNQYASYVTIGSLGNSTNFGKFNSYPSMYAVNQAGAWCDGGRAMRFGGSGNYFGQYVDRKWMDYVQIATTGNSTEFGQMTEAHMQCACVGDLERAVIAGDSSGENSNLGKVTMEYVTIATKSDASDFGDYSNQGISGQAGTSNNTRGIFAGGSVPSVGSSTNIYYLTVQTTGNTNTFGNLSQLRNSLPADTNGTRAVFCAGTTGQGGYNAPCYRNTNTMDYVTIANTGNASDFGDYHMCGNAAAGGIAGS